MPATRAVVLFSLLFAPGCHLLSSVQPTEEQLATADFGPAPTAQETVDAIRFDVRTFRKFEGVPITSLRVDHDEPEQAWVGERPIGAADHEFRFGWRVNATISSPSYTLTRSFLLAKRPHGFGALARGQEGRWCFSPYIENLNRELAARGPADSEFASADFGSTPSGYEQHLTGAIKGQLKDPDSARIRFAAPRKTWGRVVGVEGTEFGWSVTALVNAKNSYGGYVGEKPWSFMFRDGRVVSATPLGSGFELGHAAAPAR